MPATLNTVIRVVAAVIVDDDGRMLLVRKRGTEMFMQPGGKCEPGETWAAALVRELSEELGMTTDSATFEYLGLFHSTAANEKGHTLEAEMFRVPASADVAPLAEIDELAWVHPRDMESLPIAPLVWDHALRYCRTE